MKFIDFVVVAGQDAHHRLAHAAQGSDGLAQFGSICACVEPRRADHGLERPLGDYRDDFLHIEAEPHGGTAADGTTQAFRRIGLTNAGDGSNRRYVATQHGVIHVVPGAGQIAESKIFADLTDRVI